MKALKSFSQLILPSLILAGLCLPAQGNEIDLRVIRDAFLRRKADLSNLSIAFSAVGAGGAPCSFVLCVKDGVYAVQERDSETSSSLTGGTGPDFLYLWQNGVVESYTTETNSGLIEPAKKASMEGCGSALTSYVGFTYGTLGDSPLCDDLSLENVVAAWLDDPESPKVEIRIQNGNVTKTAILDPSRDWLLLEWYLSVDGEELFRLKAMEHRPLENDVLFPMKWEIIEYPARNLARLDPEHVPANFPKGEIEKAKKAAATDPGTKSAICVHAVAASAPEENPIRFQYPDGALVDNKVTGEQLVVNMRRANGQAPENAIPDLLPILFPEMTWEQLRLKSIGKVSREFPPH